MLSQILRAALAASCLLRMAYADSTVSPIPTATTTPAMNALTPVGCFSTPAPMVDYGPYTFQSKGNCQPICYDLQQPVMGLVNGTNCWCGSLIPPADTEVTNSSCSTPCAGINTEMCGGDDFWTVYLTGVTRNKIANLDPASLSSSSASKTASSAAGPSTVVVTTGPTASSTSTASSSKGSSTVGIAVGVVVGVIAIAGIVLGVVLFLRNRKRKEVEDEYKRQAAVSGFVNGGKHHHSNSSMNDSRLDPEVLAARRESTGSIADNADYSRRILQVRNPDGF